MPKQVGNQLAKVDLKFIAIGYFCLIQQTVTYSILCLLVVNMGEVSDGGGVVEAIS